MLIARFEKLYSYKRIYGKVYIVYLNNEKIIWIQDIRFYEKDVPSENIEEEALFKVIFDEETEELILKTVRFKTMFDSGESLVL